MAGGRSSRFGTDKALARLSGETLIDHAAAALRHHVDTLVVIGGHYPGFDDRPDYPQPDLGPLGGIGGALRHAAAIGADSVLTVPCDVPSPPDALFTALDRAPSWCADHPVFGHWPTSLLPELEEWLREGRERSVRGFARAMGAIPVHIGVPVMDVDTPEDLERMQ
nr:molybdenum cofactor guanylyltransferase [Stakelama sediminis]